MSSNDWRDANSFVGRAFSTAESKLYRLVTEHPDQVPVFTLDGKWHLRKDEWAPGWTAGFLAGMLWILVERTGSSWWREQAERYSKNLEYRKFDEGTHDIGFLFTPSWGRWRCLHDSESLRDVLAAAGRTMAARFNAKGQYLSSWVDPGSTFIDIMMNIDIIYEAAEITRDTTLRDIASAHAATTRRHLVRGDFTTIHEGWFDTETGEFLRAATHQGFRADSSWVRGQTWAIYGFGSAYARTGDQRFFSTARQLADAYIERSAGALPPNDWEDPQPELEVEASAGSIAAAALAQLADLCAADEDPDGDYYRKHAGLIVELLAQPKYLASDNEAWDGLIQHAIYHRGNELGVDESVMWGDYYFLEAVNRLSRLD